MPFLSEPVAAEKTVKYSLIPALEHLADSCPNTTWIFTPKSPDLKGGWREISYAEISNAVNGLSRWIDTNINIGSMGEVVAYMGENDIRYIVVLLALAKLGLKTMLPSPKNSADAQSNLFKLTECNTLLHSAAFDVSITRNAIPGLETPQIPKFDELVRTGKLQGSYQSRYSLKEDETVLILHTSGSTGLPKPIYLTNGFVSTFADLKHLSPPTGRSNMVDNLYVPGRSLFNMMPFFHMAALFTTLRTLFLPVQIIVTPTGRPINSEIVIEILKQRRPNTAIFAPSILEDMSNTPEGLDAISKMDFIVWSGAPLAHEAGERIRRQTRLAPLIGTTEAGILPTLEPEASEDWGYYEWCPESGIEMDLESDGLYECVIRQKAIPRFQGVFNTFPDLKEWRTKDLYARHPTKPNLWEYRGRKDDVLVLSNGEKVQPVTFEKALEDHPLVQGALVIGEGWFQTSVLIEPAWQKVGADVDVEELLEIFWPTIERANKDLPAHGRVWRSMVAIAKSNKPFIRAGKGSITRRATVKLYEAEIEEIYSNDTVNNQLGKLEQDADVHTVKSFVRQALKIVSPNFPENAADDTDFFSIGLDSLQVLGLSTALTHTCSGNTDASIAAKDIYSNPSIKALSNHILRVRGQTDILVDLNREDVIIQMIKKYSDDLPERSTPRLPTARNTHTVILTGSTGGLGNYILQELISQPKVSQIYCLNRSSNAEDRQRLSFQSRGIIPDFGKVTFLHTDFSLEHFGLSDTTYNTLLATATLFIHNAWAVDFNKALTSYEQTHIAGVRRVVDFSLDSSHNTNISFVSSISTIESWSSIHRDTPSVPEETFLTPAVTSPQGYGESKFIAEHILRIASTKCAVPSTVIRAGQLAGPSTPSGIWNPNEWIPSIASTSKAMGLIPATLGNIDVVDWVPVDIAAQVVSDLVFARAAAPFITPEQEVYHLVNPRTTTWSSLAPVLQDAFSSSTTGSCSATPRIVSFSEWVDMLKKVPQTREAVEKNPGVKLLDFYVGLGGQDGGLPRLETKKTEGVSVTMQGLGPVDEGLMRNWLRQWGLSEK